MTLAYLALAAGAFVVYKLVARPAYNKLNDSGMPIMMRAAPSGGSLVVGVLAPGAKFRLTSYPYAYPYAGDWVQIQAEHAQSGAAVLNDLTGWIQDI